MIRSLSVKTRAIAAVALLLMLLCHPLFAQDTKPSDPSTEQASDAATSTPSPSPSPSASAPSAPSPSPSSDAASSPPNCGNGKCTFAPSVPSGYYAGNAWLGGPQDSNWFGRINARLSSYQIARAPLSRSSCTPGSAVTARLVFRLPPFSDPDGTKAGASSNPYNTAGLSVDANPLAISKTVKRCVLTGVKGKASPEDVAAAVANGVEEGENCAECNSFVTTSDGYVKCPSETDTWYVDTLPLQVPSDGWCDDGSGSRSSDNGYAGFVVNAGSEVDVALFDVV